MKPEFFKPFDHGAAHAGAPFCCADGTTATILKWDMRGPACPIAGAIDNGQFGEQLIRWTAEGVPCAEHSAAKKLVMLPLGVIDGKPVFVGDQIEAMSVPGDDWIGITAKPGDRPRNGRFRWSAPAKVYPEFSGDLDELREQQNAVSGEEMGWRLLRVANFALRHAVDAGQVVPKDEHEAALQRLGEQLMGISLGDRAARDMAVANAVRNELVAGVARYSTGCSQYISSGFDFEAIIVTIK